MCPYQIELTSAVKYYRPGVPYHCRLSVKDHYGVSVKHKPITVKTDTGVERSVTLDDQGVTSSDLPMPDEADFVEISVSLENRVCKNIHTIEGLEFTSSQYLQISSLKRNLKDPTVSFIVRSNVELSHLYYFVTSRGNILLAKHERCYRKRSHMINFELTVDMTVQSKLFVYTLNSGHFIMDHCELNYFANEVEVSPEEYIFQPNQDVELNVKAEKDSYVAFQAIDQGAFLEYDGFGLKKAHVLEDLDEYTHGGIDYEFDPVGSYGLFSRTDFDTRDESRRTMWSTHHTRRQPRVKPILFATGYAESWFWKNYTMDNKKELAMSDVFPKTITSWYVTGFALSPSRGIGLINAPVKLTVSRQFFIIANFPYSIKRFKVVRIQVTLFNFLTSSLPTNVTLYNQYDEFELVDRTPDGRILGKQAIVVPYDQPTSVSFLIKAKKLGDITIKIEAVNHLRIDELEHILRVIPENHLRFKSEKVFINLTSHGKQKFYLPLDIPKYADQESVNIQALIDPISTSLITFVAQT
nr:A.superbus venom factor 2-like [Aedes albopictus]